MPATQLCCWAAYMSAAGRFCRRVTSLRDFRGRTVANAGAGSPDYAVADIRMTPTFNVWRRFEPADTLNFYAFLLNDAGLISGTPEQLISRGTDFN